MIPMVSLFRRVNGKSYIFRRVLVKSEKGQTMPRETTWDKAMRDPHLMLSLIHI